MTRIRANLSRKVDQTKEKESKRIRTDPEKGIYSPNSICRFMGCERSFYNRYHKRLVRIADAGIGVLFGTAWHKALACWYRGEGLEKAKAQFEIVRRLDDVRRTPEHGSVWFEHYVSRYEEESFTVRNVEANFLIMMPDSNLFTGVIDLIVERPDGSIYIVDHKTKSRMGSFFLEEFRPDFQIDGYAYACRELVGRCDGVIINAISTDMNPRERFMRGSEERTEKELDDFEQDFMHQMERMKWCRSVGRWGRNTTECNRWGRYKCEYLPLCLFGIPEHRLGDYFDIDEGDEDE